jgi:hypothetical protein
MIQMYRLIPITTVTLHHPKRIQKRVYPTLSASIRCVFFGEVATLITGYHWISYCHPQMIGLWHWCSHIKVIKGLRA